MLKWMFFVLDRDLLFSVYKNVAANEGKHKEAMEKGIISVQ